MTNAPRSITDPQFGGIGLHHCSLCGQEMHGTDHAELQRQRIAELEAQLTAVVRVAENWDSYHSPIAEIQKCLKK